MNANLITDLEIIRDKLQSLEETAYGHTKDRIQSARWEIGDAILNEKQKVFATPYSERK